MSTRSGGYTDQARTRQLREDRDKKQAEAANRRLKKAYALAEHQAAGQTDRQPDRQTDRQTETETEILRKFHSRQLE